MPRKYSRRLGDRLQRFTTGGRDGQTAALTILAGLMVVLGAAEDGIVFGIGSAQARIGRPLTPMSYAGVARRTTRRAYRRGYYYGGYHY